MTYTPVEYVENGLGAHKVWEDSQKVNAELHQAMRTRDALIVDARRLQDRLEARETELLDNLLGAYANMPKQPSQAQVERDLKSEVSHDEEHGAVRKAFSEAQSNRDAAVSEVRALEFQSRALTARMLEIGDVLKFYAACKDAQTQARSMSVTNPAANWPF